MTPPEEEQAGAGQEVPESDSPPPAADTPPETPVFEPWPAPSSALVFGLAGEWAGADGRPRVAPPVTRIGVVLPGPAAAALAVEPAMAILRAGFPEARIVVLGDPAMGALAVALGIADDALPPDGLPPAPFDLLLDLGAGAEPLPDAPLIAGLGAAPHLAIAVPAPPGTLAPVDVAGLRGQWLGATARRQALAITLEAEGAHSPASAGLGTDQRLLGFALLAVTLEDLGAAPPQPRGWQGDAIAPMLARGWHPVESTGAWSAGELAGLSVPLDDAAIGPFRVMLRLRGHIHAAAPEAVGILRADGARPALLLSADPAPEVWATLDIPATTPVLEASAEVAVPATAGLSGPLARLTLVLDGTEDAPVGLHVRLRVAEGRAILGEARWSGVIAGRRSVALDLPLDASLAMLAVSALVVDVGLEAAPVRPVRLERAWLGLPAATAARGDPARAAAWAGLAQRCVALLGRRSPAVPAGLRGLAPRQSPAGQALRAGLVAARDAGGVVVAVLAGEDRGAVGNGGWGRVATALAARKGVHLLRPKPGLPAADLAALLGAVDIVVGPLGLAMALAGRLGLTGLVVLAPGEAAPDPSSLGWIRHGGGDALVPAADVVALLAPEIEARRQRRA
ncbi:hypothetical protein ACQW02_10830 [Humitalea sp. 24SJ18S-53]|uniref:hypothetical protein n=1 Tax=Humitalea sp. 24SJ18S-53 TaxID=3422307 RepID=UPI003D668165